MSMTAPMGHNLAPVEANETDALLERLAKDNGEILHRHSQLLDGFTRLPEKCDTEETAQKLTTFGVQLKACADALETKRKEEKQPYDTKANAVHNFFKTRTDAMDKAILVVKAKIKSFLDAERIRKENEAAEQKRLQEAEAQKQRESAQKLLEEAAQLQKSGLDASAERTLGEAQEAEQQAQRLQQEAQNTAPVQAGMVRGSGGGSSGTSGRWVFEIEDVSKLDLEALRPYFALAELQKACNSYMRVVTKAVKPGQEPAQIAGGKIKKDSTVSFRG